ncbi:MAG: hypothetical protein GC204_00645 [Chloroflexi bacterium]|nr:hypothetical protein [Chloroflexota bacterium]
MYLEVKKGQQSLHRQNDPSPYILLGWMRYLDGENISDLVIASPTVKLIMRARGADINLSFSGDAITNPRNVTVSRAAAVEMALYFLKNEGLSLE